MRSIRLIKTYDRNRLRLHVAAIVRILNACLELGVCIDDVCPLIILHDHTFTHTFKNVLIVGVSNIRGKLIVSTLSMREQAITAICSHCFQKKRMVVEQINAAINFLFYHEC